MNESVSEDKFVDDYLDVSDGDQEIAVIGFKHNVQRRQEIVSRLCEMLKSCVNQSMNRYCQELLSCTDDKRSIFSLAYIFGGVPTSMQEIVNLKPGQEISQEAVDNLINSFDNDCRNKIGPVLRIIGAIEVLHPSWRAGDNSCGFSIQDVEQLLEELNDADRLILENLSKSATWKNVYALK
jgi:hypothetical protein